MKIRRDVFGVIAVALVFGMWTVAPSMDHTTDLSDNEMAEIWGSGTYECQESIEAGSDCSRPSTNCEVVGQNCTGKVRKGSCSRTRRACLGPAEATCNMYDAYCYSGGNQYQETDCVWAGAGCGVASDSEWSDVNCPGAFSWSENI